MDDTRGDVAGCLAVVVLALIVVALVMGAVGSVIDKSGRCDPTQVLYYRGGVAVDACNPFAVR